MSTKDVGRLVRRVAALPGWSATITGGGHWRIAGPDALIFCSHTPGDQRALRNVLARLRRAGVPEVVLTGRQH